MTLIQNPYLRNHISLAGPWHIIVDPYETGALNMFREPNPYGYHLNQNPATRWSAEYDFARSPTLLLTSSRSR